MRTVLYSAISEARSRDADRDAVGGAEFDSGGDDDAVAGGAAAASQGCSRRRSMRGRPRARMVMVTGSQSFFGGDHLGI